MARDANNEFMRYHHVRSCIYFSVSALEAFLNGQMRRFLESQGMPEHEVFARLRQTAINNKLNDWPSEICGQKTLFPDQVSQIFAVYRDIRNETTHPKRKDHSIYPELEDADPNELAEAISTAMVIVHEGMQTPFPYWLLGWNYVGMNGNAAYPHQSNNMNGFFHSLRNMGAQISPSDTDWDRKNMITLDHYHFLKRSLDEYQADIEPYWGAFPHRPRLTRRWWDHEFIYRNVRVAKEELALNENGHEG